MDYFSLCLDVLCLLGQSVMHIAFVSRLTGKKQKMRHFAIYLFLLCIIQWFFTTFDFSDVLPVGAELTAADGVYRAEVETDGACFAAMANLGCNPSVGGNRRRLEVHLFGFEGSLYGRPIRVRLFERIRGERKFASIEALREQLEADRRTVLEGR